MQNLFANQALSEVPLFGEVERRGNPRFGPGALEAQLPFAGDAVGVCPALAPGVLSRPNKLLHTPFALACLQEVLSQAKLTQSVKALTSSPNPGLSKALRVVHGGDSFLQQQPPALQSEDSLGELWAPAPSHPSTDPPAKALL